MFKKMDFLVKELLVLIIFYGIITEMLVLFVMQDKIFDTIGLLLGVIVAAGMCIHMKLSLDDAVSMGEEGAIKHIRKTYGIRVAAVMLIMGLIYYFKIGSILMYFIGIMSLKVAAYMQPITHKNLQKYIGKGR